MPVNKINGVSLAAISKINGIAKADIRYWGSKVISSVPVPTGLIIPYNSDGADPSGWNTWTTADGCYIIGAGDTYAVDDTAASEGAKTITVESAGAHTGAGIQTTATGSGGGMGTSPQSAHNHTMALGTYVPPYQEMRLIKADAGETTIPQNGVIQTWDTVFELDNIWTNDRMLKANTALGTGGSNSRTGLSTSAVGNHNHGNNRGHGSGGEQVKTQGDHSSAGGHSHSGITATISNTLRQYALAAWEHASNEYDVETGMIGMYESLTPPTNWVLCDGDNGTPDLRNYFIKNVANVSKGAAIGDGTLTVTASLTHSSHNHNSGTIVSVSNWAYHGGYAMTPHIVNQNYSWLPAYYALAFIMKD